MNMNSYVFMSTSWCLDLEAKLTVKHSEMNKTLLLSVEKTVKKEMRILNLLWTIQLDKIKMNNDTLRIITNTVKSPLAESIQ